MTCLNDDGYLAAQVELRDAVKEAAALHKAAATLIAIDNAAQALKNYKQQRDLSSRSLKIAEDVRRHAQDTYNPREVEFLAEHGRPEPIEAVETMGRRYGGRLSSTVAAGFAEQMRRVRCDAPRYATSATEKRVQDLMMARGQAIASARVLGRQIAFAEYQARTDTNYQRRLQAVAVGRGLMSQTAAVYARAGYSLETLSRHLADAWQTFEPRDEREALDLDAMDLAAEARAMFG